VPSAAPTTSSPTAFEEEDPNSSGEALRTKALALVLAMCVSLPQSGSPDLT
jgi:hypothetical protein